MIKTISIKLVVFSMFIGAQIFREGIRLTSLVINNTYLHFHLGDCKRKCQDFCFMNFLLPVHWFFVHQKKVRQQAHDFE
jgi:hypothetical protein